MPTEFVNALRACSVKVVSCVTLAGNGDKIGLSVEISCESVVLLADNVEMTVVIIELDGIGNTLVIEDVLRVLPVEPIDSLVTEVVVEAAVENLSVVDEAIELDVVLSVSPVE